MNKEEYLEELKKLLNAHLSNADINDILRDYGEYFEDGRRQNKTDIEISAKLGSPKIIAQQFIEESTNGDKDASGSDNFFNKIGNGIKAKSEEASEAWKNREVVKKDNTFISGLYNRVGKLFIILITLFVECFVLPILFWVAIGFLIGMGIVLCGFVATALTIGILSPFITLIGLFVTVFLLCLCGFVLMGLIWAVTTNIRVVREIFIKVRSEEVKSDVQEN